MIPDINIRRAAQVMIKGYGDGAATEAAKDGIRKSKFS